MSCRKKRKGAADSKGAGGKKVKKEETEEDKKLKVLFCVSLFVFVLSLRDMSIVGFGEQLTSHSARQF